MKSFIYMAATVLLCTSCFHVNTNWNGGLKNAIKGEGPVITKTFEDLKGFDKIVINGHSDVVFTQSPTFEVTLNTQENILDYIDFHVDGTTLVLETKNHRNVRAERYDLTIKAPVLKSLEVSGAADFEIPNGMVSEDDFKIQVNGAGDLAFTGLRCNDVSIQVNGAGDVELTDINVRNLKVEVNGAGDANISGNAAGASFSVNGAGGIDARDLKVAGEVSKHTSGLAKIQL